MPELPKVLILVRQTKSQADKKVVLVGITTTNEFFYLKPILAGLIGDKKYWLVILADKKIYADLKNLVKTELNKNLPVVNNFWAKFFLQIDIYLNATLSYDTVVPAQAKHKISLPHSITSKSKADIFSPVLGEITDIFVTGPAFVIDLENYYQQNSIKHRPVVHQVGCPKSDELFTGNIDKKQLLQKIGLDPDLPTVFYAPTWNQEASVYSWLEDIMVLTKKFKINLIIKLHPGAYADPRKVKVSGGVDWKKFFVAENLKQHRIYNVLNDDSADFVKITDLAITDISTTWIEFYLLRKPIVFLDIPQFFAKYGFNSLGDFRHAYGYVVKTAKELDEIMNQFVNLSLLVKNPPALDDQLLFNKGQATPAALSLINSL